MDHCSTITQEIYIDRQYYDRRGDSMTPSDGDGFKRHLVKNETHKVITAVFPTLERFAFKMNVSRQALWEWATFTFPMDYKDVKLRGEYIHPRFAYAYARAREMQESILVEN